MPLQVSINNLVGLQHGITKNNQLIGKTLERQSSGSRINRAVDDAAGLAISESLRSEITAIGQASKNISAGSAMLRTAEGALSQIGGLVARGRELAIQASNGTLNDSQRNVINQEFNQIKKEIDRIASTTEFNGQSLLKGDLGSGASSPISIQVGTGAGANSRITLDTVEDSGTQSLGLENTDLSSVQSARAAITDTSNAVSQITQNRARIGALENRFQAGANNLAVTAENLIAADSQIRDTDYAKESSEQSKNSVLIQAGIKALQQGITQNENLIGSLLNKKG